MYNYLVYTLSFCGLVLVIGADRPLLVAGRESDFLDLGSLKKGNFYQTSVGMWLMLGVSDPLL